MIPDDKRWDALEDFIEEDVLWEQDTLHVADAYREAM